MLDYAEKRDFPRMPMDCPARLRLLDTDQADNALVRNLRSNGLLLLYPRALEPGSRLNLEIIPGKSVTPPLAATARVLRSNQVGDGNFHIACQIERILPEREVGPDFP